jgi:dihydrodipicolinate synthase/N-acetylneuraminate lyase
MITASDLNGLMAMMPAFATDDAGDIGATSTISVERMESGINRMIADGGNVISTTGSFGECHTLLLDEFETLAVKAAQIVNGRVPLFIGTTSLNAREVVAKMRIVERTKAAGVLVGVPFYYPSSPENAVRFYRDIAAMFPKLGIMIYHNPTLHNVKLSLPIMEQLVKISNVVAMKDSHRNPVEFMRLMDITRGKMTVFVNQLQYATYAPLGACGFWSIDAWMGPWPQLALRDAVRNGDLAKAIEITLDLAPGAGAAPNMQWRENGAKLAIRYSGYVDPGPLRPPFLEVPTEIDEAQRKKAERWKALTEKYRPLVHG